MDENRLRLEHIKKILQQGQWKSYRRSDIEWLIEQAEELSELKKEQQINLDAYNEVLKNGITYLLEIYAKRMKQGEK